VAAAASWSAARARGWDVADAPMAERSRPHSAQAATLYAVDCMVETACMCGDGTNCCIDLAEPLERNKNMELPASTNDHVALSGKGIE
jgi:hypothetical protein